MKIQKRGGTNIIPNHALDNVGNPSKACLPPSRPSLTCYALEYGGALRMIRVSVFSNALCLRGVRAWLYSPKLATCALGSNRLKKWQRCILGGGGKPT
jgi:hypothetical protein